MKATDETQVKIEPTFVIDFLATILKTEITNHVSRSGNTLLIELSNHTTAQITAPLVACDTQAPLQSEATIHNIETLHHVLHHDYGYGVEDRTAINRLELRNIEECCIYIEDAISSQLNAYFTNHLIEFMSGEKFLLAIELKQ